MDIALWGEIISKVQGRTIGQSDEFCKETSPHCQYYLFEIKWFKCIHVGSSFEVYEIPKSHNALNDALKFFRYV